MDHRRSSRRIVPDVARLPFTRVGVRSGEFTELRRVAETLSRFIHVAAEFIKFGSNHYPIDRNWAIVQRLQLKATKTEPIKSPDQVGVR